MRKPLMGAVLAVTWCLFLFSPPAFGVETLSVALTSKAFQYVPLVIAEERGYTKVEGIELKFVFMQNAPGLQALMANTVQFSGSGSSALVAISKGPDRDAGREHFYLPGKDPFRLDLKSPVLYYLQRLRDEAHRFAIGSHRKKRSAAIGANPLDEVAGVGANRKRALLQRFGSARAVAAASLADLQSVGGVSETLARKIFDFFHPT